jgi:pimeloyl-ACP methyl ester carboxylesterase
VVLHDFGGAGRPALLAHATGFAGRIWEPVLPHLVGYRCFGFDARGHGRTTTPPTAPLSWLGVADDVLATVDALGLRGCVAAGHSMGAATLLLAELARPGTFASLYCYEPVTAPRVTDAPMRDDELAAMTLRRRDRFDSATEARANFASKPPFADFSADSLDAYLEHGFVPESSAGGAITLACRKQDESEFYRQGRLHGLYERLGEVRCPVVVAAGVPQPGAPSAFAADIAGLLPKGRLVRYDDLGHFGPQQDPARIGAAIVAAWTDTEGVR